MIELHPKIIRRRGQQFAVLPLAEFQALQTALARLPEAPVPSDTAYGRPEENLSAAELAWRQGVSPIKQVADLYGDGDPADWEGFDEALEAWRRGSLA